MSAVGRMQTGRFGLMPISSANVATWWLAAVRGTNWEATAIDGGADVAATMPFCELPLFPTPSSPRDGVLPVISIDRCRRLLDNPARALTLVPCGNISNVDQRLIDTVSNNAKRRLKIELSMPCGECAYACTSRRLSFDPGHFLGWRLPNRAPCNLHKPPESNRKRLHYSNEAGFPNVRNWAQSDP